LDRNRNTGTSKATHPTADTALVILDLISDFAFGDGDEIARAATPTTTPC
jgi:hypothetical protein